MEEERGQGGVKTEYGICFTSNDGKETHIVGHYSIRESAEASAEKHRKNGNRDVFIVERNVTDWKPSK
jgi:hypothetical protein